MVAKDGDTGASASRSGRTLARELRVDAKRQAKHVGLRRELRRAARASEQEHLLLTARTSGLQYRPAQPDGHGLAALSPAKAQSFKQRDVPGRPSWRQETQGLRPWQTDNDLPEQGEQRLLSQWPEGSPLQGQ